jgi:hypothetical protein
MRVMQKPYKTPYCGKKDSKPLNKKGLGENVCSVLSGSKTKAGLSGNHINASWTTGKRSTEDL